MLSTLFPNEEFYTLCSLGWGRSLDTKSRPEFQSREKQLERRAGSLAGKPYFTTDKGLIGISTALETAPIKNGDSLAVIDASPAYLVLREVKSNNDHSDAAQRHQIIARAVETESRDKMKERLVGIQRRVFQII